MNHEKEGGEWALVIAIPAFALATIFGGYLFIGFLDWIWSDPLNLVSPPPTVQQYESPDIQLCRDKGGLPIKSAWDGRLKRCDNIPN